MDIVDTELLDEFGKEYADYGNASVERVRFVLTKLDNDRRADTDYFSHKFMGKIESIFSGLPKPKEWRSLFVHDLPLLTSTDEDVQQIAVDARLNKSQTKALQKLKEADRHAEISLQLGYSQDSPIGESPSERQLRPRTRVGETRTVGFSRFSARTTSYGNSRNEVSSLLRRLRVSARMRGQGIAP